MFTGIVEELGTVVGIERLDDAARLLVHGSGVTVDTAPGDSLAVNGCCLTVSGLDDGAFAADVMAETLLKTTLGGLRQGDRVNLERAATLSTRLGGHLVQGHVDGTGRITAREPSAHWEIVHVEVPQHLGRYLVSKGSVAVDGVSLTVVDAGDEAFSVSLIPETLARTTLGARRPGDRVNLEVDVIAKYVERLLGPTADPGKGQEPW